MVMALKKMVYILLMILILTCSSCAQRPVGPMGGWGRMMGYGYIGGFVWIIIVVIVGVTVYFILKGSKSRVSDGSIVETPVDILKKRYAKGEIDKEEFERKKSESES